MLDGQPQVLKQIQHNTRIESAGPCAHAEAVEGRETHGRVDAFAVAECTETGAAAQMRDNDTPVRDFGATWG